MATTWSSHYEANQTLSGGSLVATSSGAGFVASSRTLTAPLSYFEVKISTLTGTVAAGVANLGIALGGTILGGTAYGCGYESSGAVIINNTTITTLASYAVNAVIGVAVNMQLGLIWFTLNGSTWNNAAIGSQNPVGNVGGISLATMTGAGRSLLAAAGGSASGAVLTGQFSSGGLSYTPPTGYSALDGCGAGYANGPRACNARTMTRSAPGKRFTLGGSNMGNGTRTIFGSTGTIAGTVKEGATSVSGRTVRVYDTLTGVLVNAGPTGSGGAFSFTVPRRNVDVVAKDPTSYEAQIYDNVAPI